MLSVAACGSAVKAAPQSGVKFDDAVAQASMAYIQVNWRGWVILPDDISTSASTYIAKGVYGPYTAVTACSGFVASGSGDIVTAGHCVDGSSIYGGKGVIIQAMLSGWKTANGQPLSASQTARRAALLEANARVEGYASGSPVDSTVKVALPAVSHDPHTADVVAVQPFTKGDVALLRVAGLTAPALPVAQANPQNGDGVVAAGYPGDVAAVVDSSTPASFLEGTVSGTETVNGTPFTQISSNTSAGMSGGPVLNTAGQVVGTVSWGPSGTASENFMTDVGSIRSILAGNGVSTKISPATRAFRMGLAYYFAQRYHEAVKQFDRALALQPQLTMATDYRQKSVAAYPNDVNPPSKGTPLWVWVAIGAGVLALAGGVSLVLLRRHRPVPPSPAPSIPGPGPAPPAPVPPAGTTPAASPVPPAMPAAPAQQVNGPADQSAGSVERQEQQFCPNCGQPHAAQAHYCERCGQPFPGGFRVERSAGKGP